MGEIVATDNGDPTSFVPFQSHEREAFNGLVLAIVRARKGEPGRIVLTASSDGLRAGEAVMTFDRRQLKLGSGSLSIQLFWALPLLASPACAPSVLGHRCRHEWWLTCGRGGADVRALMSRAR